MVLDGNLLSNCLWFSVFCVSIQCNHQFLSTNKGKSHGGYSLGCSFNRLGLGNLGSVFVWKKILELDKRLVLYLRLLNINYHIIGDLMVWYLATSFWSFMVWSSCMLVVSSYSVIFVWWRWEGDILRQVSFCIVIPFSTPNCWSKDRC